MRFRTLPSLFLFCLPLPSLCAATSPKELLAAGRVDEAIQTLEQRVSRSATDAESYNLLCRAYFMIDEWDRGIPACERARNLDPQKSLYHLWLGRIYGEKADHAGFLSAAGLAKKVRVEFERAVELDPESWEARADLAEFYLSAPAIVGGGKDKARAQANAIATPQSRLSSLDCRPHRCERPRHRPGRARVSRRHRRQPVTGPRLGCTWPVSASATIGWTKWSKRCGPGVRTSRTARGLAWTAPACCCAPAATIPLAVRFCAAISLPRSKKPGVQSARHAGPVTRKARGPSRCR